ncbi:MAG: hypothetical protein DI537_10600 [Stutzerimonas stutzeri]|nr:MAG: hypothetical protein DI537_10600 [Stutzerimonas stutzeri]
MDPLRHWRGALRTSIILSGSHSAPLDFMSVRLASNDAKSRYKAPHAPGAAYSPTGRRIKDWETRR